LARENADFRGKGNKHRIPSGRLRILGGGEGEKVLEWLKRWF
jgi:hypothetical protein